LGKWLAVPGRLFKSGNQRVIWQVEDGQVGKAARRPSLFGREPDVIAGDRTGPTRLNRRVQADEPWEVIDVRDRNHSVLLHRSPRHGPTARSTDSSLINVSPASPSVI